MGIPAQIFDYLGRILEGRLAVDNPLLCIERRGEQQACLFQEKQKLTAKLAREHPDRQKELSSGGSPSTLPTQPASGDNAVDVRVVHEVLTPGVEHCRQSGGSAEVFPVGAQLQQGFRYCPKEQLVGDILILQQNGVERIRKREHYMEVASVQQVLVLLFCPFLAG